MSKSLIASWILVCAAVFAVAVFLASLIEELVKEAFEF